MQIKCHFFKSVQKIINSHNHMTFKGFIGNLNFQLYLYFFDLWKKRDFMWKKRDFMILNFYLLFFNILQLPGKE